MDMHGYLEILSKWFVTNGIPILLILFITIIALKLSKVFSKQLIKNLIKPNDDDELRKRELTLRAITKSFLDISIIAIGIIVILNKMGIDVGPILAAAGVAGIAVGFGARRFVEDIITGFIILIEDQIRVGDVVQIGDKSGFVEKLDLKTLVLRDISGNVHYIRNGMIDIVTNMTKDFSCYVFDIGVSYKEDIDGVINTIAQVDEDMRCNSEFKDDILKPIEILGVDKFGDSAIYIKAKTTTKPIKQWAVGREFNKRLKIKFDQVGIQIPFPHRTIIYENAVSENHPLNVNTVK